MYIYVYIYIYIYIYININTTLLDYYRTQILACISIPIQLSARLLLPSRAASSDWPSSNRFLHHDCSCCGIDCWISPTCFLLHLMATMSFLKFNDVSTSDDAISCDCCYNTIHYKCLYLSLPAECRSQNMPNTSGLVSPFLTLCSNVIYALKITCPLVITLLMINLTKYKLALSLLLPNYPHSIPITMTPPS